MTVTRLMDMEINATQLLNGVLLESLNKDVLIQSQAVVHDPRLNDFLNGEIGGNTVTVRQLTPLQTVAPNVSNDNPDDKATPNALGEVKTIAVRQSLNQGWSSMDLVADKHGTDPMLTLRNYIADYWRSIRQQRLLSSIKGLIADSVANHSGDLVNDIAPVYKADSALTAADFISANSIIDTTMLMGDRFTQLKAIAVHSVVYAQMVKTNLVETKPLADSQIQIPHYMQYPIVIDDNLTKITKPAVTQPATPAYDCFMTFLFGYGAFTYAAGGPKLPFETERSASSGHGGGQETLWSRIEMILHPQGYQCNLNDTPTVAQLEAATSWTRAWERKRVPLAVLVSRG